MIRERTLHRLVGGDLRLGPVRLCGRNAMHFAVVIDTPRGYLCTRLPLRCFGRWWPLYLYWSPDCTPGSAHWIVGNGWRGKERRRELRALRGG